MRVRKIIIQSKKLKSDTSWRTGNVEPCHAPCFPNEYRIRDGFAWRSSRAVDGSGREYVLWARCAEKYGRQFAVLMLASKKGTGHASVVARYEKHHGHGGIHAHFDCNTSGLVAGGEGMDNLKVLPKNKNGHHRRTLPLTDDAFWEQAMAFFRFK